MREPNNFSKTYFTTLQMVMCCIFMTCSIGMSGQQEIPELDEYGVPIEQEESDLYSDTISGNGPKKNTLKTLFRGRPGKAALYSLIIPGGGQVYNKKWWKLPLVFGIEGAAIYNVYYTNTQFKRYDEIFKTLSAYEGTEPLFIEGYSSASQVKGARDIFRKRKEYSWLYAAIAHLVTVFDAYVDRHLIEFDIEEDLNVFNPPGIPSQPYVGLTLKYTFE